MTRGLSSAVRKKPTKAKEAKPSPTVTPFIKEARKREKSESLDEDQSQRESSKDSTSPRKRSRGRPRTRPLSDHAVQKHNLLVRKKASVESGNKTDHQSPPVDTSKEGAANREGKSSPFLCLKLEQLVVSVTSGIRDELAANGPAVIQGSAGVALVLPLGEVMNFPLRVCVCVCISETRGRQIPQEKHTRFMLAKTLCHYQWHDFPLTHFVCLRY